MPQVQSYKYFGVWLHETGKWDKHLFKRFASADCAFHADYHTVACCP